MYMGVCKSKKARRIDIKVYPKDEYPFALLYFTGSD
jgi:DNA polymerase/3'-5' exonuclease PolX